MYSCTYRFPIRVVVDQIKNISRGSFFSKAHRHVELFHLGGAMDMDQDRKHSLVRERNS